MLELIWIAGAAIVGGLLGGASYSRAFWAADAKWRAERELRERPVDLVAQPDGSFAPVVEPKNYDVHLTFYHVFVFIIGTATIGCYLISRDAVVAIVPAFYGAITVVPCVVGYWLARGRPW